MIIIQHVSAVACWCCQHARPGLLGVGGGGYGCEGTLGTPKQRDSGGMRPERREKEEA